MVALISSTMSVCYEKEQAVLRAPAGYAPNFFNRETDAICLFGDPDEVPELFKPEVGLPEKMAFLSRRILRLYDALEYVELAVRDTFAEAVLERLGILRYFPHMPQDEVVHKWKYCYLFAGHGFLVIPKPPLSFRTHSLSSQTVLSVPTTLSVILRSLPVFRTGPFR